MCMCLSRFLKKLSPPSFWGGYVWNFFGGHLRGSLKKVLSYFFDLGHLIETRALNWYILKSYLLPQFWVYSFETVLGDTLGDPAKKYFLTFSI